MTALCASRACQPTVTARATRRHSRRHSRRGAPRANATHTYTCTHENASQVVEDVDWSRQLPETFASVGDDRRLCIWDCRAGSRDKAREVVENAHAAEVRLPAGRLPGVRWASAGLRLGGE